MEPAILYKYRPPSPFEHIIALLSKGRLWFSSAKSFNDPFDTAIALTFDGYDTILAEQWAESAATRAIPNATKKQRDDFIKDQLTKIRTPGYLQEFQAQVIQDQYDKFGICCLSKKNDDILMWGHYSASHSGFCIGIDVDVLYAMIEYLMSKNELLDLKDVW